MDDQQLEQLISAWLDGRISESQSQQLQQRLRESADARKMFVQLTRLDAAIRRSAEGEDHADLGESSAQFPQLSPEEVTEKTWMSGSFAWGYLAFALGLVCLSLGVAYEMGKKRTVETTVASSAVDAVVEETLSGYASLRRIAGVRWPEGTRAYREGDVLPAGLLQFEEGVAEIDFFCGATLVVEGPAKLMLESDWSARLLSGRVRASVPPAAQGFILKAADSEVVDLGTEFALDVGPDYAHVEVIDGEVKLRGGSHDGNHLTTGQSRSLLGDESDQVSFNGLSTIGDVGRLRQAEQSKLFSQWKEFSDTSSKDDRLIAYYPIAATIGQRVAANRAKTGSERDAFLVGPVSIDEGRFGGQSSAIGFDRPGSRLRTRIDGEFNKFTFACWVRIDSLDNLYNALFMADGYENGEPHWQIQNDGRMMFSVMVDDTPGAGVGKLPNARLHRIYYTDPIWDSSHVGQWMHLAVTYDPSKLQVCQYVNGERVSKEVIRPKFYVEDLRIGASEIGNWGQPFRDSPGFAVRNLNGLIDEMVIFDASLDEAEINTLYENGKPFGY